MIAVLTVVAYALLSLALIALAVSVLPTILGASRAIITDRWAQISTAFVAALLIILIIT